MSLSRDLLDVAQSLLASRPGTEASARRAVSTACYALFHLLIDEACALWPVPEHRARLARQFDHKRMRDASAEFSRSYLSSTEIVQSTVGGVANAFLSTQQMRHKADYDRTSAITPVDAASAVYEVELAFFEWDRIKDERLAHDFLYALLFKDRS